MKSVLFLLGVAASSLCAAEPLIERAVQCDSPATQVVVDPSFEDPSLNAWTYMPGTTLASGGHAFPRPHQGQNYIQSQFTNFTTGSTTAQQQLTGLDPDSTYIFSYHVIVANQSSFGGTCKTIALLDDVIIDARYFPFSFKNYFHRAFAIRPPSISPTLSVGIQCNDESATAYIDTVTMTLANPKCNFIVRVQSKATKINGQYLVISSGGDQANMLFVEPDRAAAQTFSIDGAGRTNLQDASLAYLTQSPQSPSPSLHPVVIFKAEAITDFFALSYVKCGVNGMSELECKLGNRTTLSYCFTPFNGLRLAEEAAPCAPVTLKAIYVNQSS